MLANAIDDNVALTVQRLGLSAPVLAPLVATCKLEIVGARYNLDSGMVTPVGNGR